MSADKLPQTPLFNSLDDENRRWLNQLAEEVPFSFQQLKMLVEFCLDMGCWNSGSPQQFVPPAHRWQKQGKKLAEEVFNHIRKGYEGEKGRIKRYSEVSTETSAERKFPAEQMVATELKGNIMGTCPVASEKTRCCNLRTLDAVQQCGFDCSYCSIQSFYHQNQVRFISNLDKHLAELALNPKKLYHIGTGQSSDSLMWGNHSNLLDSLCQFARKNPNVILEMKSKSGRIEPLLPLDLPFNMVFTWSLNPPVVIRHEEVGTASFDKRIASARAIADKGNGIGFHFHPMIWYEGWQDDYTELVNKLTATFQPEEVIMISLGTLTFIKPVIKRIRQRYLKSSILKMPMEEIGGKLSYPLEIKKELFTTLYQAFPDSWKDQVFFYMCMEDIRLWEPVFGRSYPSNELFGEDMLEKYMKKLQKISVSKKLQD